MNSASSPSDWSDGAMTGSAGASPASFGAGAGTAGFSATSPGTTTTLTQRSRIDRRTAISSTRGICSGLDTSSQ